MSPFRYAFSLASPAGKNGRLSIFIFHRVPPKPDPLFPDELDAQRFDQQMCWISSWFNVLPLDQAIERLSSQSLPERAAAITFDDGYADNYTIALPILQKHGLSATFFIATGFIDGGRMWNDTIIESIRHCQNITIDLGKLNLGCHCIATSEQKRSAIQTIIGQIKYLPLAERVERAAYIAEVAKTPIINDLMMTSAQIQALRDTGMQIGAHTVSHPILARINLETAREEIAANKEMLEHLLKEKIRTFAYPNGKPGIDYLLEHRELVKQLGFSGAVSTTKGVSVSASDIFQLPRFTPWSKQRIRYSLQLLSNCLSPHVTTLKQQSEIT